MNIKLYFCALIIVSTRAEQGEVLDTISQVFVRNVLDIVGNQGTITVEDIASYLDQHRIKWANATVEECFHAGEFNGTCLLQKVCPSEQLAGN